MIWKHTGTPDYVELEVYWSSTLIRVHIGGIVVRKMWKKKLRIHVSITGIQSAMVHWTRKVSWNRFRVLPFTQTYPTVAPSWPRCMKGTSPGAPEPSPWRAGHELGHAWGHYSSVWDFYAVLRGYCNHARPRCVFVWRVHRVGKTL